MQSIRRQATTPTDRDGGFGIRERWLDSPSHWTSHNKGRGHAQRLDPLLHGGRGSGSGVALILCCHCRRRCCRCQSRLLLLRGSIDSHAISYRMVRGEGIARIAALRIQAPRGLQKKIIIVYAIFFDNFKRFF